MVEKEKHIDANLPAAREVSSDEEIRHGEWTEEDERRIRWRMDVRMIPTVLMLYLMCFIDRSNIGNARIEGMATDLKLVGYRFNWALTIFYLAYIGTEIPSNLVLKLVGAQIVLPSIVIAFGLISLCHAFLTNFHGLLAARFFLGIAEGGTLPGIAYYLSCFYKRHELLLRVGIFIQGATLAGAFGGLLAAGLSEIPKWGVHSRPIYSWRNIFFFEGLFTVLVSGLAIFILPSSPDKCEFLTPKDRYIALERINREHKETSAEKTQFHHVKRGILNIDNVLCGLGYFSINVSVQSFSLFLPTILQALGWTALKTQFYSVPPYAVACVWSVLIFRLSDKYKIRGPFLLFGSVLAIIGYSLLATSRSNSVKYGAVFLASMGAFPGGPIFLAWGLNNAAGQSIRAVSSAYIVGIGSSGALLAVWTYLAKDAPLYRRGHYINIGASAVAGLIAVVAILYTRWENRMRAQGKRDGRLVGLSEGEKVELGYRHPEFRYTS
ncbi:MFS general substrate transporter [Mollisia scopiformis]|uniref:MFS general substrate transporter n=1 Tax=Mollisia scopiformis TaxID=149040 RepID=A0A132B8P4_MOLSC|nr:MFS general substrate transporter [Mollisia scopiformis]KUJ08741.1 MFS general substrate transporter [Mollisia scopiformis]